MNRPVARIAFVCTHRIPVGSLAITAERNSNIKSAEWLHKSFIIYSKQSDDALCGSRSSELHTLDGESPHKNLNGHHMREI